MTRSMSALPWQECATVDVATAATVLGIRTKQLQDAIRNGGVPTEAVMRLGRPGSKRPLVLIRTGWLKAQAAA